MRNVGNTVKFTSLIALDIGYGFVKVATATGQRSFHSVVGPGSAQRGFDLQFHEKTRSDSIAIELGGKSYFLGRLAIRRSKAPVRALARDRNGSEATKLLALGALALLKEEGLLEDDGLPITLISGAPPGWMQQGARLERLLAGEHEFVSRIGGRPRHHALAIRHLVVLPQALGAYWHQVSSASLEQDVVPDLLNGRVGVIDVGFRTTDLAAVIDGEYIPEASHTLDFGFYSAAEELGQRIEDMYALTIPSYGLDEVLMSGVIRLAGSDVSVVAERDEIVAGLVRRVLVELASRWQALEYDTFLVAGGASRFVLPGLNATLGRCVATDRAAMANVLGYLQYGSQMVQE